MSADAKVWYDPTTRNSEPWIGTTDLCDHGDHTSRDLGTLLAELADCNTQSIFWQPVVDTTSIRFPNGQLVLRGYSNR